MTPLSVTLNDLEGHLFCLMPFRLPYLKTYSMY